MKIREILGEEFSDYTKNDAEEYFSIFKNPSSKDYEEIQTETKKAMINFKAETIAREVKKFRFLLDTLKKDVYAFSVMALHQDVIKSLRREPYGFTRGRGIIAEPYFELNVKVLPDWAKKYLGQK